jgi:hypothetical protein
MSTRTSVLAACMVALALLVGATAIAQTSEFPEGLTRAFQSVGQSILGENNFFATKHPPNPSTPATLVVHTTEYPPNPSVWNVYDGAGRTYLRITVYNGQVVIENDTSIKTQDPIELCSACGFENPPLPQPDIR